MRPTQRLAIGMLAALASFGQPAAGQDLDRRQLDRIQQMLRNEGQAIVALADAADAGVRLPADFAIDWHNDFLKAQAGTFVPFIVSITSARDPLPAVLLYVRLAQGRPADGDGPVPATPGGARPMPVFEEIYPVELPGTPADALRVARGFSVPPGDYDLSVVVRERERLGERSRSKRAGVIRRHLSVPDYETAGLTTSTVMLAERLTVLREALPPGELTTRPYAIGTREVHPAADAVFGPGEELIVLFLVYNPTFGPGDHFDLEVEYHFFRQEGHRAAGEQRPAGRPARPAAQPGEVYVNRTEPQRFNPLVLGPASSPIAGQPVLAGQGVPLGGFQEGDYRLAIMVKDLVSGEAIERQVRFAVRF